MLAQHNTISVLLVDDHTLVLRSLGTWLQNEPGIQLLGTASSTADAISECDKLKPQVVVMDIVMPGMSSFRAANLIKQDCPDIGIIFLSAYINDRYIQDALAISASFVSKTESPEAVIKAIRAVTAGQRYYSPDVKSRLIADTSRTTRKAAETRFSLLSNREIEILRNIAQGKSKKEVARLLGISVSTVDNHTNRLMKKLDIHDRVQLTRFAIREGLIQP